MLARKILDWCDRREKVSFENDSYKAHTMKCCGLGFLEGAIDGAVICGLALAASGGVQVVKKLVKK